MSAGVSAGASPSFALSATSAAPSAPSAAPSTPPVSIGGEPPSTSPPSALELHPAIAKAIVDMKIHR
jgi:hypothetical protein